MAEFHRIPIRSTPGREIWITVRDEGKIFLHEEIGTKSDPRELKREVSEKWIHEHYPIARDALDSALLRVAIARAAKQRVEREVPF